MCRASKMQTFLRSILTLSLVLGIGQLIISEKVQKIRQLTSKYRERDFPSLSTLFSIYFVIFPRTGPQQLPKLTGYWAMTIMLKLNLNYFATSVFDSNMGNANQYSSYIALLFL